MLPARWDEFIHQNQTRIEGEDQGTDWEDQGKDWLFSNFYEENINDKMIFVIINLSFIESLFFLAFILHVHDLPYYLVSLLSLLISVIALGEPP